MYFGRFTGYIGCFYKYTVAIAKHFFIIASYIHNGYNKTVCIKIKIAYAMLFAKCLPAILKISHIMPMPYNTQRIYFAKLYIKSYSMYQIFMQYIGGKENVFSNVF